MGTLIDSSVFVAAERAREGAASVLASHSDQGIAIAAVTASELLHGVHRAATASQRARRESFVEAILATVPVAPFDLLTARIHARLWAELASKGKNLGAHDLLIGATALALGFDVATRDRRSFPKIPGLKVLLW
jgi:predicted nucleic acid-binding protein